MHTRVNISGSPGIYVPQGTGQFGMSYYPSPSLTIAACARVTACELLGVLLSLSLISWDYRNLVLHLLYAGSGANSSPPAFATSTLPASPP